LHIKDLFLRAMTHFGPPASHVGGMGSIPVEYRLCFWWINWHWLGQVIIWILRFFLSV